MRAYFYILFLFILSLVGCGSSGGGGSSSGGQSGATFLGTLPNGSNVYASNNSLSLSGNASQQTSIYLVGGTTATFNFNFSDTTPGLYGSEVTVSPSSCSLGTQNSGVATSCNINVSSLSNTYPGTYTITSTVLETNESGQTILNPITVLVSNPIESTTNSIASFSLNGVAGVITGSVITVTMPYGSNLNSLVANYVTTGESVVVNGVSQISGQTANNFSSPLIYTVYAQNGARKNYTVIVNIAESSAESITAFSINGVAGVISGTNISLTLPNGTSLNNLVATFTTTGQKVVVGNTTQASGVTQNNFSDPVVYTVYAQNGSSQNYVVSVSIAKSDEKAITAFALDGHKGTINGTSISVNVPFKSDITDLTATFTTTGESVMVGTKTQKSGVTPNNFTNPVTYTVYAQDGTSQDYTVTVTIPHYLYVANTESTSISRCAVTSDGSLTSCANVGGTGVTGSTGIVINRARTFAYITNANNNTVSKCNLDDDGNLSGCVQTATGVSFRILYAMALDGKEKYAYVTNVQSSLGSNITYCNIQDSGDLSGCGNAASGSATPAFAIVINKDNNIAYVTAKNTVLFIYNINDSGTLSEAEPQINLGGFTYGLSFDTMGKFLYVASYKQNTVSIQSCNIGSSGVPTSCPYSSNQPNDQVFNIALNQSAGILYVVENSGIVVENSGILNQCNAQSGVISNCTPTTFPSGVAITSGLLFK